MLLKYNQYTAQLFDSSLNREDAKEFNFEAANWVGSYLEQKFRVCSRREEPCSLGYGPRNVSTCAVSV